MHAALYYGKHKMNIARFFSHMLASGQQHVHQHEAIDNVAVPQTTRVTPAVLTLTSYRRHNIILTNSFARIELQKKKKKISL
jgi:hypothetical protein